jgi:6-phosphofructokinase 1
MDRILGTRLGVHAVELVRQGKTAVMAGVTANELSETPLIDTWTKRKKLSEELINIQQSLFNPIKKDRNKSTQ